MSDKRALRTRMRSARDAFARDGLTIGVPDAFAGRLRPGITVAAYVPIGSEADPAPLVRAAATAGCTIALPHVTTRAEPLRFLAWDDAAALAAGPFGLSQPHHDARAVDPAIILTPLVAFDARGNRIGQGAGHYDRAFVRHPDAWRIGIAWSVQQADAIDAEPWDVPLHAIATERGWIIPGEPTS